MKLFSWLPVENRAEKSLVVAGHLRSATPVPPKPRGKKPLAKCRFTDLEYQNKMNAFRERELLRATYLCTTAASYKQGSRRALETRKINAVSSK